MRLPHTLLGGLACLLVCAPAIRAETVPSPLRLIPAEADLLVQVKSPRQILDMVTNLELVKELQKFPATQELFNSTASRRFFQLLAYYEKELGAPYPELVERLTSGGVALGVKLGPNPAPALLVIQGRDEKLTQRFVTIALKVAEQEFQRQEQSVKLTETSYQGIDVTQFGKEIRLAVIGSTILVSNNGKAIEMAIDLYQGREGKSLADSADVAAAARLLPKDVLASLWLNMETVRKAPGAAEVYKTPRDPAQTILFGIYLDVLGRTPYICGGIQKTPDGALLTFRAPCGREGMGADLSLNLPPEAGVPASLPLLEPKGVLYSDSYYFDLGRIWEDRSKLFGADVVKGLEQANKGTSRIPLSGVQLSKLLTTSGPHFRVVVANQPRTGYKTQPRTSIPAFAVVNEMRDPDTFSRSMEIVLRGVALFAGNQAGLKLVEEKYKDCNLVGYRFPEDRPLKADYNNTRFNYSPCFVRVGNQFVASSTIELARELVDLLQQQAKEGGKGEPAKMHARIYAGGVAEILRLFEDQLVTQAILDQAVPATAARKQVLAFLELLHRQGSLNLSSTFTDKEAHYDIRFQAATTNKLRTTTPK
jgi:hypothetical protein